MCLVVYPPNHIRARAANIRRRIRKRTDIFTYHIWLVIFMLKLDPRGLRRLFSQLIYQVYQILVHLMGIISNQVPYNIRTDFREEIWCTWRDSNPHACAVEPKSTVSAIPPQVQRENAVRPRPESGTSCAGRRSTANRRPQAQAAADSKGTSTAKTNRP